MNTRALFVVLSTLFIAALGQSACNSVACVIDPCQTASCPANPSAKCVADYCNGCNFYFVDAAGQKVDCKSTCEGQCDPAELLLVKPAPCVNADAKPFWACRRNILGNCGWHYQCGGTCCLSSFSMECNASSIYNGDWCPETTTCCLTTDVIGAGINSFSCCAGGYNCTAPSTPIRGGYSCQPVDLCSTIKCDATSACVVVNGVASCQPIVVPSDPCMTVKCAADTKCVSIGGQARCVPLTGKPGQCPAVKPGTVGVCGGVSVCFNDYDCPLAQKCCNNGCGGLCTDPVSGTVKPGTCPTTTPSDVTTAICYETCTFDSDCLGDLKCCGSSCNKRCVLPEGKTCDCGIRPMIAARDCGDGVHFADYICNPNTCKWEFKDCECNCNYSAFTQTTAVDTASSLIPGTDLTTKLPTCLVAVAEYSSDVKAAATASVSTTTTTTSVSTTSTSNVQTCFGKGGCQRIGDKCVPFLSCENCIPTLPPPKCVRAGCQQEKCVAAGSAITLECAGPSYEFECLKKAVCDVDATGNCGWQKTDAYVQCMKDPVQSTKDCSALDACSCAKNSSCLWCLSNLKVKPSSSSTTPVDVPVGVCVARTERNKCLAPKAVGGLEGKMVDSFACDPSTKPPVDVELTKILESKDTVALNKKIAEKALAQAVGLQMTVDVVFNPAPTDEPNGKGVVRSIVKISPKPTPQQIDNVCSILSAAFFEKTQVSATKCQLSEIVDSAGSAAGSVKRQASSTSGEYLYQTAATGSTSGSAGLTFGFIAAMSSLVVALLMW